MSNIFNPNPQEIAEEADHVAAIIEDTDRTYPPSDLWRSHYWHTNPAEYMGAAAIEAVQVEALTEDAKRTKEATA